LGSKLGDWVRPLPPPAPTPWTPVIAATPSPPAPATPISAAPIAAAPVPATPIPAAAPIDVLDLRVGDVFRRCDCRGGRFARIGWCLGLGRHACHCVGRQRR